MERLCEDLAGLIPTLVKPVVDVAWFSWQVWGGGAGGGILLSFFSFYLSFFLILFYLFIYFMFSW